MFSNMDFFGFFSSFIFKENHVFNEEDNPSKKSVTEFVCMRSIYVSTFRASLPEFHFGHFDQS